jgi:hypothetical protein
MTRSVSGARSEQILKKNIRPVKTNFKDYTMVLLCLKLMNALTAIPTKHLKSKN